MTIRAVQHAAVFILGVWLVLVAARASAQEPSSQSQPPETIGAAIVTVTGDDAKGQPIAPARGFFVREDVIVTDYQAIKDAAAVRVTLAGQEPKLAVVAGVDKARRLALIHLRGVRFAPLLLGRSSQIAPGARVYLPGDGGRAALDGPAPCAVASVSEIDGARYFRLDKPKGEGVAGAPLLDGSGHVVGVVASRDDQGFSLAAPGSILSELIGLAVGDVAIRVPGGVPDPALVRDLPGHKTGDAQPDPRLFPETKRHEPPPGAKTVEGVVRGAQIRRAEPLYPLLAKTAQVEGRVVVSVTLNEQGEVIRARAISGHPLLTGAAEAAAMGWLFTPTLVNGKPSKVIGAVTFNFYLKGEPLSEAAKNGSPDGAAARPVGNSGEEGRGVPGGGYTAKDIEVFKTEIQANPDSAETYFKLGEAYYQKTSYQEAANAYREALRLAPTNPYAQHNLGLAYFQQREFDRAIQAFNQAIAIKADHAPSRAFLAFAYYHIGRYEQGVEAARQALAAQARYADADAALGLNYLGLRRYSDALAAFQAEREIRPYDANANLRLGSALAGLGRYDEALSFFIKASEIDPYNAQARFTLGRLSLSRGDTQAARRQYEALKSLNKDLANSLRELIDK